MKNTIYVITIILTFLSSAGMAQPTFKYVHSQSFAHCIELSDNRYAINFDDSLIIFAQDGSISEARNFYSDTCFNYILGFHRTDDDRLFSTGYYDYTYFKHLYLWVREYDQDMHVIREKKHKILLPNRIILKGEATVIDSDGNAVFAFGTADWPGYGNDSLEMFKVFTDSDSLYRRPQSYLPVIVRDLTEIPPNNYYMIGEENWGYSTAVVRFNNALEILESEPLDSFTNAVGMYGRAFSHIKLLSDTTYIFTAERDIPAKNYYAVGMGIVDTSHTMLKENYFAPDSSIVGSEIDKAYISFVDKEKIFIGSMQRKTVNGWNIPFRLILTRVDGDLNVLWQKFYQPYDEDYYILLNEMHATNDGGVILINRLNESPAFPSIIFKVDSLGNGPFMLTGQNELIKSAELFIYPNPGRDILDVRTAVQRLGGSFELFDMNGRLVLSRRLETSITDLNTTSLPPGNYVFRYTHRGEIIETGKWIKQ